MNIAQFNIGQNLRVLEVLGKGAERKLFEMGIMPGTELRIIARHPFQGPVVIKIGNSEIALGRSIAQKIEVEAL